MAGISPDAVIVMSLTSFGLAFLPLCLLLCLKPERLLQLLLLASCFEAAAALIFGALGLQPNLVPAAFFVAFMLLQVLLGAHYPASRVVWHCLAPFLLVVAYALAGSLILPHLFAGQVYVWPQKLDGLDMSVPLAWGQSNVTQDLYLVIDCALLVGAAFFLSGSRVRVEKFLAAYFASGFLVAAICLWQLANKLAGVPYPSDFFYSNPGWVIFTGQQFGGVPRLNGPFSEPSALGSYMTGLVFASAWVVLNRHPSRMARLLLPIAILIVLLSTSTTGLGAMALGGAGLCVYALLRGNGRVAITVRHWAMPVILALAISGLMVSAFVPGVVNAVDTVVTATISKSNTDSYQTRTSVDGDSLAVIGPTWGLGAGWGSARAASLIPGLLANLGIYGTLLLAWFAVRLVGQLRRARRLAQRAGQLLVLDGVCGALVGNVVTACLSAPMISSIAFYALLAMAIGCAAQIQAGQLAHRRPVPRRLMPAGPAIATHREGVRG
jgi:hypothetical protein